MWIGKGLGCLLFEPIVGRLGFRKTMFLIVLIQLIGVIGESTPLDQADLSRAVRQELAGLLGRSSYSLSRSRSHRERLPGI